MILACRTPWLRRRLRALLGRLPSLAGAPVRVTAAPGLKDRHGPVHAGSFLRERRIALACPASEITRILVHELFHFVWLRLGNPRRWEWEDLLRAETARGELGWSAEWRKLRLAPRDVESRSRRWREYCCESFCDTAAWIYARGRHPEHTLGRGARRARQAWFVSRLGRGPLSI